MHDDVLGPFLAKLKHHLETIHVCLGEIESWLLEPKGNIEFIEEIFGMKLGHPTALTGTHQSTAICEGCKKTFGAHTRPEVNLRTRHKYGGIPPKFRCNSSSSAFFSCKKYITLNTMQDSGKFERAFAISKKNDKGKLQKFLDFIK